MGIILESYLNEYDMVQKVMTKTMPVFQNNEIFQKLDYAGSVRVIKKRLVNAKTKKEIDDVISIIDKNIKGMNKYKNARLNKGNAIPIVDKKLKERNFNNFLKDMNDLKHQAYEKKKRI